jgi:Leucine-rich repeat (LRR) protein
MFSFGELCNVFATLYQMILLTARISQFRFAYCTANNLPVSDEDNNNLVGYIPEDLCLLTSMKILVLSANSLEGNFPSCISNMKSLEELHVNGNSFRGELPTGLHALPNLARITLSFNEFNGTLSNLFDNMQPGDPVFPSLATLNLDDNQLRGAVPDSDLAQAKALQAMTIHNNPLLSGSLTETCHSTRIILASADCNSVICPCCNDGNNCL